MDTALRTFLVDLAMDRDKLAEFARDREAYVARFPLAPDVRAAILAGDEMGIAIIAAGKKKRPKKQPNKAPYKAPPKKKKPASKKKTVRRKRSPKRPS